MQKLFRYLENIILAFLPFSVVASIFFKFNTNLSILPYLKEILVTTLLILTFINIKKFKIDRLKFFGLSFVFYSLFSLLFLDKLNLQFLFQVLKSEVFYIAVFLLALFRNQELNLKYFLKSFELMLIIGLIIYIIDPSLFINFGFRDDYSTYYINQAPAYCQRVEASLLCRFQGLLEGPNKMGLLLSFYTFLNLHFYKKFNLLLAIALIALLFTFSRSSMLVLVVGCFAYCDFSKIKSFLSKYKYAFLTLVFLGSILLLNHSDLFLKPASTSEHLIKALNGIKIFLENPIFGHGLGFSGPASRFLGHELIVESHIISILINTGLIGFVLFSGFYVETLKLFYKNNRTLFAFWLGLLIPLNLLHSFESFVVSFLIMWISGSFKFLSKHQVVK